MEISRESGSESSSEEENTDIFDAIEKGEEADVKSFLEKGVDFNDKKGGNTPLYLAIKGNRKEIVKLLLEKNKDGSFKWNINTIKHEELKKSLKLVECKLEKNSTDPNWQSIKELLDSAQTGSSGIKNSSGAADNGPDAKKAKIDRKKTSSDSQSSILSKSLRTDPSLDPSPTYAASGVKRALDGTIYQSKLLMLFTKRAVNNRYDFRLATEMDAAEKFDDVVIKYQDQGKWTYRFLQAKHKQNPQRDKISVSDLKTEKDGDFSLQKYFVSYCKIKENPLFQEDDLKDLIIVTNTDFDFEINRKYKKDGQERKDSKERNVIIEQWEHFFEFNYLSNADEILYFGKGEKRIQFKRDAQTKSAIEKEIQYAIEKNIQEIEKNLKVKYKKVLNDELESLQGILNNSFTDNVHDFLERLIFITNYPSERELGGFIKKELGEEFDLLNADLVNDSFEKEMLDFLKNYDKGQAKFYSWKDGEEFFEAIKEKINTLMISGLSKSYPEKLRGYGISFRDNLKSLEWFLSSNSKQVFHLVTGITRLSAIKVLESLEGFDKYKNHDSYIFMRLRTLLREETQGYVLRAFSPNQKFPSEKTHDLLVIECQLKTHHEGIVQLYTQLLEALNGNSSKKIILVAQGKDALAGEFKDSHRDKYQEEDDQNAFEDLDKDSQDKVLKKEVNLQEEIISLNELIDKNSACKMIDQTSLSRLLEEERIKIGDVKAFSSVGYVCDYYIDRALLCQRIKAAVLKKTDICELFFVSGADQKALTDLGAEDLHIWEKGQLYKNGIIWPGPEQNDKKNKEIFQELGKQSGKNIHWLEYQKGNLFWRASKGKLSALEEFIDKNYGSDGKNILEEKAFSKPEALGQNVVIIANDPGVGKSTVLTSIAHKMKQEYPALWVVRINLNDYAEGGKESSLEKIGNNWGDDGYIDFVSKMAVPGDSEDPNIEFQRKIFKTCLEKIVILFDGFDEISPSYKLNTTKLIKAIKGSNPTLLWVTTRVHEKADLEKELDSLAYILNDLTDGEQRDFLSKFWKWSLKFSKNLYSQEIREKTYEEILKHLKEIKLPDGLSDNNLSESVSSIINNYPPEATEQLESLRKAIDEKDGNGNYKLDFSTYAKVLLDKWKYSIGDTEKSFTLVPLNLRMLAEVIFEDKFRLPKNLGLLDLYDKFINMKFDIFFKDKRTLEDTESGKGVYGVISGFLRRVHHELAVKLFFPEKYEEKSLPGLDKLMGFAGDLTKCRKAEEELARVGLLTLKGNELKFIHRSFAEYFLSEYLIKNLEDERVQKLLLEEILFEYGHKLIRKFFNDQLEKRLPLSDIALTSAVKDYTILHRVAQEGHPAIVKFLLDKLKDYKYFPQKLVLATDYRIQNQNPLHLAASRGHTEIVYTLLNSVKDDKGTLKALVLATDGRDRITLLNSVRVLATDDHGKSALHMSAHVGHTEIVSALLNSVKDDKDTLKALVLAMDGRNQTALHLATSRGLTEIVNTLLNSVKDDEDIFKALVLATDYKKQTALYVAASTGYTEIVNTLLNSVKNDKDTFKALVLATDYKKQTALYVATSTSHTEIVNALLNSIKDDEDTLKALVLATDDQGQTALHMSTHVSHTEIVNTLLNRVKGDNDIRKALVLALDGRNKTALHLAASRGRTEIVNSLLNSVKDDKDTPKALVLATDGENRTALYLAASRGHIEIVNALLNSVKDDEDTLMALVLATDFLRQTALHLAASEGHIEIANALLNSVKDDKNTLKALVLATGYEERTALYEAASTGHTEIVNALLNSVKDDKDTLKALVATNSKKQSALHRAAEGGHSEIFNALLNSFKDDKDTLKALVLATDSFNQTTLHLAVWKGHTEIVNALLNSVKDDKDTLKVLLLATDGRNLTALHLVASGGHTEIANVLLNSFKDDKDTLNALVLTTDGRNRTALHLAASGGHTEIANALLNSVKDDKDTLQALVLATDDRDQIALHQAAGNGRTDTLKALLDFVNESLEETLKVLLLGADNDRRKTPLHWATGNGHTETLEALLNWVKGNLDKEDPPDTTLKALVHKADEWEITALNKAARSRHTETVEALLNWVESNLEKDHPATLKAIVSAIDSHGQTLLHEVAFWGKKENVEALLDRVEKIFNKNKEDPPDITLKNLVEKTDKYGQTFLHNAAEKGHSEVVETFLDWVKKHSEEGTLADTTLKKLVLADDEDRNTALHLAANKGRTETVEALLNWVERNLEKDHPSTLKAMVSAINSQGQTLLHKVAFWGKEKTLEALLDRVEKNHNKNKKDPPDTTLKDLVEKTDKYGYTVLHYAAVSRHSVVVEAFLDWVKKHSEEGTLPDTTLKKLVLAVNKGRTTALHQAANVGCTETVKVLLDWVKVNLPDTLKEMVLKQDKSDRTALQLTRHGRIVNLLKVLYNQIASSLLKSETNNADFSNQQLDVLERHVKSYDYIEENKREILEKLEGIRSERSQNIGGGSPFHAGVNSDVLRLRGGSLLEKRYIKGYNIAKAFSQGMGRFLEAGAIEKGELPVLLDVEDALEGEWKLPLIHKEALDEVPKYFTTEQEVFTQMRSYLQEQAECIRPYYKADLGGLSFEGEVPEDSVDDLNNSFLAQAVSNWVRYGFGPDLQEGMGEDLSKMLKVQFYVQVSIMGHGALSDTKSIVDNVKLLLQEETLAAETSGEIAKRRHLKKRTVAVSLLPSPRN